MPERRYSRWKQHDVLAQLAQLQTQLGIVLHGVTRASNSAFLTYQGQDYHAVVLARSSHWYYRKPRAKAPVIHPGDEAPFLVWGGEGSALRAAMRRLTEAGKPAMLGIDVLARDKA